MLLIMYIPTRFNFFLFFLVLSTDDEVFASLQNGTVESVDFFISRYTIVYYNTKISIRLTCYSNNLSRR